MVKIFGDMCAAFGMRISTKKTVVMAVEHGRLLNRRKEGDDEEEDDDDDEEVTDVQVYDPIILRDVALQRDVVLQRVSTFCYLGHMLNSKGGRWKTRSQRGLVG